MRSGWVGNLIFKRALVLGLFNLLMADGFAYVLNNNGWSNRNVTFRMNHTGGPAYADAQENNARAMWNTVSGSNLQILDGGTTTATNFGVYNSTNILVHQNLSGSTIGYCQWWTSSNRIIDADIKIRLNYTWTESLIKATMAHEFGHAIGFGHSSTYAAIMYPSLHGQTALHGDDVGALRALYPYSEPVAESSGAIQLLDFDGDSKIDILFRKDTELAVWLMDGKTRTGDGGHLLQAGGGAQVTVSTSWVIEGLGDFNGDGNADILFRKDTELAVWIMDGKTRTLDGGYLLQAGGGAQVTVSTSWIIAG